MHGYMGVRAASGDEAVLTRRRRNSMTQTGLFKAALFMVAAAALSACSMFRGDDSPAGQSRADDNRDRGGISIFGGGDGGNSRRNQADAAIGVNAFLWRASL